MEGVAGRHRLGRLATLVDAAGEQLLWGGYEETKGYDPSAYRLTVMNPLVWSKLYFSTYMFPGSCGRPGPPGRPR